jgi:YD repeat-containing protein
VEVDSLELVDKETGEVVSSGVGTQPGAALVMQRGTVQTVDVDRPMDAQSLGALVYADSQDRVTRYAYDGAGRQTLAIDAVGAVTQTQYDGAGRVVRSTQRAQLVAAGDRDTQLQAASALSDPARDRVTRHAYDAAGHVAFDIDAQGGVTAYRYDALGQVLQTVQYAALLAEQGQGSEDGATEIYAGEAGLVLGASPAAVDPGRTYTVRARLRQLSGNSVVYVGVAGFDANGNALTNDYGGTYSYAGAAGEPLTPEMGWKTFEGQITGSYVPVQGGAIRPAPVFCRHHSGQPAAALQLRGEQRGCGPAGGGGQPGADRHRNGSGD